MKYLLLPIKGLYFLYACITFVLLMLLVFPVVIVASFFGKIKGGNFIYRACAFWADVWFFLIGIRHKNIFEVPHDKKQQFIFVANHISYLDIPVIVKTVRQPVRILAKAEMSKVPVFGFIYRNAAVTVDRSSAENRAKSVRILKSAIHKGISIFIFPEGTFNETHQPLRSFYDGAFKIAIETQTPIKPVLFLDTYARQHYKSIVSLNPGRSRSIFLPPVPVEGLTSKDVSILKERVFNLMEDALRKYKADWIS
ncbi:1-acyl-sn-glycerol-3-phosphate acyltransferase [Pseudoflavitalea sp. G-6-1-2]|uniref:lysophospholipid acyltransferase family protein n=1 Tax=Pseudoflavitalea sp. G-6-1-2 TaxID=2728841 RepID=UPI00146AD4DF|nr:lysophospholipid acyltransferase family protein [Pseudoflavitalea sp. G-6-1-2]NML21772.1 1-acyl-sn-glycerol-3-phosphate acyltransferase [Pseudoflavitalea sp. G-6-1-2]